jgi:hypothetical protein
MGRSPAALWGGIVAMIGVVLGLLAFPDSSIPARVGLGLIALACTVVFVRRSASESKEVHAKLDSLRDPSPLDRSELKVRANNIAGAIRGKVVLVRIIVEGAQKTGPAGPHFRAA